MPQTFQAPEILTYVGGRPAWLKSSRDKILHNAFFAWGDAGSERATTVAEPIRRPARRAPLPKPEAGGGSQAVAVAEGPAGAPRAYPAGNRLSAWLGTLRLGAR